MAVNKQKVVTRRIFVSMPADGWLAQDQNDLKWGIVKEIERLGYTPEIFVNPRGKPGLAAGEEAAARCSAGIFLFTKDDIVKDEDNADVDRNV